MVSAFVIVTLFSKFYILRDYTLRSEVACNPQSEVCFIRSCSEDCEEEASPEYYKIRMIHASDVPLCDPHVEECAQIDCKSVISCEEQYCTEESVPEGESCSAIENFLIEESEGDTEEVMEINDNPEEE